MGIGKSQPTRMGFFCSEGIQETLMISLMPMKSLPYPHPQAAETVNVFFFFNLDMFPRCSNSAKCLEDFVLKIRCKIAAASMPLLHDGILPSGNCFPVANIAIFHR